MEPYSVLMSVYGREKPVFLKESLESVFAQSVFPDDVVLVCDGLLTEELDRVIAFFSERYPAVLQVKRLKENRGLGIALNFGLGFCRHSLVARMDSDDIAPLDRMEHQLAAFREEGLALAGGAVYEFENDISCVRSVKKMPLTQEEILRYAQSRNPFNHPTVMFRKEVILAVGGYRHMPLHEDYDLWVRVISSGAKVKNLEKNLCFMRVSDGMYERRGGMNYFKKAFFFRRELYRSGFTGPIRFLYSTAGLFLVCLVPPGVRKSIYRILLRKK
ncbi:MAG: glycosyltransferase [Clostridia bacterium]|nr:glycosyltransferase [Clostridia bacterium]